MSALDLRPQQRRDPPLLAVGLDNHPSVDADYSALDGALAAEAGKVKLVAGGPELAEALAAAAGASTLEEFHAALERVAELDELLEGPYWDPEKHPRWPEGTPGGLGGQFMHVGQRFKLKGVEYDVAAVFPGHIYAHVATKGDHAKAATVRIETKDIAQVERPPAEAVKGAGNSPGATAGQTATVVDAYAHPETHDPSIPIPPDSPITPDEWKRFGKLDQERYSQLMERYGLWKSGASQSKIDSAWSSLDGASKQLLKGAYGAQYGHAGGFTISLQQIYKGLLSKVKGSPDVEKARNDYERTRAAQFEVAGVLQWDLYNRTHSPDVAIFKGHSQPAVFEVNILQNHHPVYAGACFSQFFRPGFFGGQKFAAPMAIRNVAMASVSGYVGGVGSNFSHEQEVACADAWLADPKRVLNVNDSSGGGGGTASGGQLNGMQAKWLEKATQQGRGGYIIDLLRESFADGGSSLPIEPELPSVQMDGAGGKQYQAPPADAATNAIVDGVKKTVLELPYDEEFAGKPVSKKVKDMVDADQLHPGDYIEGMKGTRYIVVPDPSDSYLGLAYYKLTDTGQPIAGTEIKNEITGQDTQAFGGHTIWAGGEEAYPFEGGGKLAFKKLKGHYELPQVSKEETGFFPDAWSQGGPDETIFLKDYEVGQKFYVHAEPFEVTGKLAGSYMKIKNLNTAKLGQINGTCKLPYLVLKEGYSETGQTKLDPANFFQGEPISLKALKPSEGDIFKVGQTLWKVESTGKAISASQSSGSKIGQLHDFELEQLVSPQTLKPPGWVPPLVGDVLPIEGQRATVTKILKSGEVQVKGAPGGVRKLKPDDPLLANIFRPADWELGDEKVKLKQLGVGDKFHGGTGAKVRPYRIAGFDEKHKNATIVNLETGEESTISARKSFLRLVPKGGHATVPPADHVSTSDPAETFDPHAWEAGAEVMASELKVGDKFTYAGMPFEFAGGSPEGVSAAGAIVKNLNTGVLFPFNNKSKGDLVSLLVPKGSAVAAATPSELSGDIKDYVPTGESKHVTELKVGALWISFNNKKHVVHLDHVEPDGSYGYTNLTTGVTTEEQAGTWQAQTATPGSPLVVLEPKSVADAQPAKETPDKPPTGVPVTGFDPGAYTSTDVALGTLGDLLPGEIFQGKTGGYFEIKNKSGTNVYAVNLSTGKSTKLAAKIKPKAKLYPKATGKAVYEQLLPGDPVQLKDLKKGDQFKAIGDQLYEVITPPIHDEENAVVATVDPDGSLGAKTNAGGHPLLLVTLHSKAADTVETTQEEAVKLATDPADLPKLSSYESYLHPHAGKKKYPKLQEMTVGTVFHDKKGTLYKIKQAGETPVISDGTVLVQADGEWRGFVPDVPPAFPDTSPDPVLDHGDVASKLAEEGLQENTGKTMAQLELGPGDTIAVKSGGDPWTVSAVTNDGWFSLYNPKTGETNAVTSDAVPAQWKQGHGQDLLGKPLESAEPPPLVQPTVALESSPKGGLPNAAGLSLGALAKGTEFSVAGDSGTVVFKVGTKLGKGNQMVEVVAVPSNYGGHWKVGETTDFFPQSFVPETIGSSGSHVMSPDELPKVSSNLDDYDEGPKVTTGDLQPGEVFKSATGAVFQVTAGPHSKTLVSVKNVLTGGEAQAAFTMPTIKLVPKPQGGDIQGFAPFTGTLGDLSPGDQFSTGLGDGGGDHPTVYEITGPQEAGGVPWKVVDALDDEHIGGTGFSDADFEPTYVKQPTVAPVPGPQSGWPAGSPPPQPKKLPANHQGKTLKQITLGSQFETPDGSVFKIQSKGAVVYVNPVHLEPGDPVASTNDFGYGYIPVGVAELPENQIKPDVATPKVSEGEYELNLDDLEKKQVKDFPPGSTVGTWSYGALSVYRILEHDYSPGTSYGSYTYTKAEILKGYSGQAKGQEAHLSANTQVIDVSGIPWWQKGDYAKLVKPGNKSGQVVRVAHVEDSNNIHVLKKNGEIQVVPQSWLAGVNPQSATYAKFTFPQKAAGDLQVGEKFFASGLNFYSGAKPILAEVTEKDDDGTVHFDVKTPYFYGEKKMDPNTMVEPWSGRGVAEQPDDPPDVQIAPAAGSLKSFPVGSFVKIKAGSADEVATWKVLNHDFNTTTMEIVKPNVAYPANLGNHTEFASSDDSFELASDPALAATEKLQKGIASIIGEPPTTMGDVHVGDVVGKVGGAGDGQTYLITKKDPNDPNEFTFATNLQLGVTLPFGSSVEVEKIGSTESYGAEPPTIEKVPLNTLTPASAFYTAAVSGTPAGVYKVLSPGAAPLFTGYDKAPDDIENPIYAQNVETGKVTWFGDTLPVVPLGDEVAWPNDEYADMPASVQPPGKKVGDVVAPKDLEPGDFFTTANDATVYKVVANDHGHLTLVKAKEGAFTGTKQVGVPFDADYSAIGPGVVDWKLVEPFPIAGEPEASEPVGALPDVIEPYKWPKGGKYKYPHISTLAIGDAFKDKNDTTFVVTKTPGHGAADGYVHYKVLGGAGSQEYATPSTSRVLPTA